MEMMLIDKSAEARWHEPEVAAILDPLLQERVLATCAIMDLEMLFSARSGAEHAKLAHAREGFVYLETTEEVLHRAKELQGLLAQKGQHRAASIPDLIISAIAEHQWCYGPAL